MTDPRLLLLAPCALAALAQDPEPVTEAAPGPVTRTLEEMVDSITVEEIEELVAFFASSECAGRGTGTPGFDLAAEHVEQELARLGLEPAGAEGGYRLPFTLESVVPDRCSFALSTGPNEGQAWQAGADFLPLLGSPEMDVAGEPVFAGFAIDAKDERWSDLPAKKIRGKVVFAFTREPFADNARSKKFDGLEATEHSLISNKAKAVADAGGIGLVIVPDPGGFPAADRPLTGAVPAPLGRGMNLDRLRQAGRMSIPVMTVSRAVAEQVFGADLQEYWEGLEKRKKSKLLEPAEKDLMVELGVEWTAREHEYYNLAARLRGSDGDGEVVVLGAHLDHVGSNYAAAELFRMGTVATHPGADDNASGSSALLEVAEAVAGTQPKEDLLFLWFSGEEIGLLGSQAYCREPVYPHEKTLVMLNMDQIGRTDPKEFNLGGTWDAPEWEKLAVKAHRGIRSRIKMDTSSGRDMYMRSDQFSFFQQGVPALFFFEGSIQDNPVYHQPGDVPGTMPGDKTAAIAQVFLAVMHAVAYEGQRP